MGHATALSGKTGKEILTTVMFDNCSLDCWVSKEFAVKLQAKKLSDWQGVLTTIKGKENVKLPAVEVKVYNHETKQIVKLQCLVTNEIGYKPKIQTQRFERLCHAFGLNTSQVEVSGGKCELVVWDSYCFQVWPHRLASYKLMGAWTT